MWVRLRIISTFGKMSGRPEGEDRQSYTRDLHLWPFLTPYNIASLVRCLSDNLV